MRLVKTKSSLFQILRFGIVGTIATIVHYIFFINLSAYFDNNTSYSIAYFISLIVNFFLTTLFTFRSNVNNSSILGFSICHIINYSIQILLLNIFIYFGIESTTAPILVYMIAIPTNYFFLRLSFKLIQQKTINQ